VGVLIPNELARCTGCVKLGVKKKYKTKMKKEEIESSLDLRYM
jgi:hypothetical protein